jgi:protein-arginine kinase activator protein McsA
MRLLDYIKIYTIDLEATEGFDYLIELINEDLVKAVDREDYEEAKRLQDMIESLPSNVGV